MVIESKRMTQAMFFPWFHVQICPNLHWCLVITKTVCLDNVDLVSFSRNMWVLRTRYFFSITSGSMSRHTITGEKLKPFDFLAQRYRVVAGHDTQVHLVPAGAPVALSLRKLSFGVLIGQLVVWKLGQVDAVPFLHQSTMKLGIQSIKVFKAFTIAINHFIFVSSCSEVS